MPTVIINIEHRGLGMTFPELRFQSDFTLRSVKEKLMMKTGTEPDNMELSMVDSDSKEEILLGDDTRTLQEYDIVSGMDLVIVDTSEASISNNLNMNDVNTVEKVVAKAGDSGFAAFRKKAAGNTRKKPPPTDDTEKEEASKFHIGDRIKTKSGNLATVRFIGPIEPLPKGYFLGCELDEAVGKNDGKVKGVRLFQCDPNKGAVLRPSTAIKIEVEENDNDSASLKK